MRLLVVRHAAAEDKDAFARTGESDDLRPLTAEGKRGMREIARGLRSVAPEIDVLATSPLLRAVQTAEIVGAEYDRKYVVIEALRPEAPYRDVSQWTERHGGSDVIAVVGHEPHLSGLVSWLLSGATESFLDLKKGGACLLEIESRPGPGSGLLLWALAPKHLRAIGRG